MGPGLSWDAHLETWIGWYGTRMELIYNSAVEKGPGWKWDTNHRYMLHRCHSIQLVNLTMCNWCDSNIFIEYICGKHHWFLYYTFASLNINTSLRNPWALNNIKQWFSMFPVTLLWQNHTWYTHNDFECLYVMLKRIKCKNCRGLLRDLSMDWGEMQTLRLGSGLGVTWFELRRTSWDLDIVRWD